MGNRLVEIYKVNKQFNEKTLVDSFVMPINGRKID